MGSRADIAKYLIENGADVNVKNIEGEAILHRAVENTNYEMVKLLVENGANVNIRIGENGPTPLHMAVEKRAFEIVKLLVEHGADLNAIEGENGPTPLYIAAENRDLDIMKYLIEKGAKIDPESDILIYAVETGNLEIVKLLVEKGVDINVENSRGTSPLDIAIINNYQDIIKYLLGQENLIYKHSYLINASAIGNLSLVKYFIENGADVNAKSNKRPNETPLHVAAFNGHLEVIKYLIEHGADVNIKDYYGKTPLFWAVYEGQLNVVKYFIEELGLDITIKDARGITPMHYVVLDFWKQKTDVLRVIKYLIEEKGVDVNIQDARGNTLLTTAIRGYGSVYNISNSNLFLDDDKEVEKHLERQRTIIEYLLQHGADPSIKNIEGKSSIDYAKEDKLKEIIRLINKYKK